jgi:hypothetical protein
MDIIKVRYFILQAHLKAVLADTQIKTFKRACKEIIF